MPIHKLATGPLTLTVVKTDVQEGQFGTQVVFDGEGDVRVYVNELTAMKQLARLNLTLDTVLGKTLHLEQIKKDGKAFTNINLAGEGAVQTAAGAAAAPAPRAAASAMSFEEIAALYAKCVDTAFMTFGTKCEEFGVTTDASALQSAAATLFIRASK